MGRKIPGRKHHGVRDPEKQRAQRLDLQKVNAPPSNADDQPVPKSVQRIADLMNKVKNPQKIIKKPKKKGPKKKLIIVETKVGDNEKPVPKLVQKIGESDKAFLNRCNRICENEINEVDLEIKFGSRKMNNGAKQKDEDPVKKMMKEAKQAAKKKPKKKKKDSEVVKLTKSEKRKLKLQIKKEKKKEKLSDKLECTEKVKFGEVYHAPPELTLPRNVIKKNEASRPGQKNLLLKAIINGDNSVTKHKEPVFKSMNTIKKVTKKTINKKGKRKDLPSAVRKQLEQHQKEIIEAYKAVKAKKKSVN